MAEELSSQAEQLADAIAYFKLKEGAAQAAAGASAAAARAQRQEAAQGVALKRPAVRVAHAKSGAPTKVLAPAGKTAITLRDGEDRSKPADDGDFEEF